MPSQNTVDYAELEAEALANTPHKADKIARLGSVDLVKILQDAGSSTFEKAKACQRLAVVGDDGAVPALAALLGDEKLSHYARFALEPLPGAAASKALRDSLDSLDGDLLIGVINSIGRRKDPESLDALAKLRHHDSPEIQRAASAALGRMRSP